VAAEMDLVEILPLEIKILPGEVENGAIRLVGLGIEKVIRLQLSLAKRVRLQQQKIRFQEHFLVARIP
jgi:hypothetical protein